MATRDRIIAATVTALCLASAIAASPLPPADSGSSLTVRPSDVSVGLFHHGARLEVEATVPAGDEIAIICSGGQGEVSLTTKGKALGLFWLNTGEVTLAHVPALYQVNTERSLCELARPAVRQELGVGYDAIEANVTSDRDADEERRIFDELVKLKEREGLYAEREDSVQHADLGGGLSRVSTTCWLPARTPFGSYQVDLYGFNDGDGTRLGSAQVAIRPVGLVAFTSVLAARHGLLYGILAVGVAIVMGLLTGVVFGRGGGKAH